MSSEKLLSISVVYGDVKVDFSGSPDVVLRSLHEFIAKEIPNIDLARSITVSHSLNDLIQMFKDYIRFTPEGPRVWAQERKLSDKEVIALELVAAKASNLSGKSPSEGMSVSEIQAATGLYPKTISSRLSELVKQAYAERSEGKAGGVYRMTTTGTHWLQGVLSKKYKTPGAASSTA